MIDIIYSKIQENSTVDRYYLLSTCENIEGNLLIEINEKINKGKKAGKNSNKNLMT